MCTHSERGRFVFDLTSGPEKSLEFALVEYMLGKVGHRSRQTFEAHELDEIEFSLSDLVAQFVGMMEERCCERVGNLTVVAVLTGGEVGGDHLCERVIEDAVTTQPVRQRREPGDRRDEDQAAWTHGAPRFSESANAIASIGQVVERAEDERCIEALAVHRELACVADMGRDAAALRLKSRCLVDVRGHDVDENHIVAAVREPYRIHPNRTADVEDPGGPSRKVTIYELLGPEPLDDSEPTVETRTLVARLVVPNHFLRDGLHLHLIARNLSAANRVSAPPGRRPTDDPPPPGPNRSNG
jgi:hypothetical protein